jgi:hypothetical protein
MLIVYEGLNTILPRIESKLRLNLMLSKTKKDQEKYKAQLDVIFGIDSPEDVYTKRGELWANRYFAHGREKELIEAQLEILDEIEGIHVTD